MKASISLSSSYLLIFHDRLTKKVTRKPNAEVTVYATMIVAKKIKRPLKAASVKGVSTSCAKVAQSRKSTTGQK